ncbi:MAG: hypothetical protein L3K14_05280 [Thermoplasmata archaeon]|nr:hypothetical protein [Thermoplasmata archaeon]
MATAGGTDLVLFVAGEPDSGVGSTRDVETSIPRNLIGAIVGRRRRGSEGRRSGPINNSPLPMTDHRPWHIPSNQIQCANMVFEIAKGESRRVALVDVNRAAGDQALVDRWVGSDAVLPLLVRRDGARLQGIEEFVPSKVRRLVLGLSPVNSLAGGR